jgi:RNA-directed DNA polymerase
MGREWRTGYDEAIEALQWGNPQSTARRRLPPLNHSFTLDSVVGFQHQPEADRFLQELGKRLGQFGLELHPEKTRRIEFGRLAEENRKKRGEGKPETFDFLGFTHISGKNSKGYFVVRRRTMGKRMRAKLQKVKEQLRKRRHDSLRETGKWLKSVVQGYFQYYAVPGNLDSLGVFRERLIRLWRHSTARRSQRYLSWDRFRRWVQHWIPQPRVLHPWPERRFAATHPR